MSDPNGIRWRLLGCSAYLIPGVLPAALAAGGGAVLGMVVTAAVWGTAALDVGALTGAAIGLASFVAWLVFVICTRKPEAGPEGQGRRGGQARQRREQLVTATLPDSLHCIAPDCNRMRHRRGLCRPCYDRLRQQIRTGRTTWAAAEASGLLLAADKAGQDAWAKGRR